MWRGFKMEQHEIKELFLLGEKMVICYWVKGYSRTKLNNIFGPHHNLKNFIRLS